jgi:hypothetical protein
LSDSPRKASSQVSSVAANTTAATAVIKPTQCNTTLTH